MGHGMEQSDQMFSVHLAPWHIGETRSNVLQSYPSRAEAMVASGLNWTVEETPIYRKREGEYGTTFPALAGWKALYRNDTMDVLHVAKDSYAIVQNEVGFDIAEAIVGAGPNVLRETGGSIFGGKQCYLCLKVDEPVTITGDNSPILPYVVVTWSHDGSGSVQARRVSIRPVCNNTISAGELEGKRTGRNFTFRHTKNVMARIEDAKAALAGSKQATAAFAEIAEDLARISISDETREKFVRTFVPMPEADVISDRVRDNIETARGQVRGTFDSPTIPETHRNTAYGLLLAGGEYLDHLRASRNSDTYLGRTLLRDEPLKAKLVPTIRELVGVTS